MNSLDIRSKDAYSLLSMNSEMKIENTRDYKIARISGILAGVAPVLIGTLVMSLYFHDLKSDNFLLNHYLKFYNYRLFSTDETYLSRFNEVIIGSWSYVVLNSATAIFLTNLALKRKVKWLWFMFLFFDIVVVFQDFLCLFLHEYMIPTVVFPFFFLTLWLYYARKIIWS